MSPERKSMKVLDLCVEGVHLVCIMDTQTNVNPYRLYHVWYHEGYHRKLLKKYGNFVSVIEHISQVCHNTGWGFAESFFDWGKRNAVQQE